MGVSFGCIFRKAWTSKVWSLLTVVGGCFSKIPSIVQHKKWTISNNVLVDA